MRLLRPLVSRLLLLAAVLAFAQPAWADFYVVVNAANPQRTMTQKDVVDLYMGRSRAFGNGQFAIAFDLPRDSPERAAFYQSLTGLSAAQVDRLREEHAVYLIRSGRMCVAGLSTGNVERTAQAMAAVLQQG